MVCRGEVWTRVRQLGEAVPGRSDGVEIVAIGPLTFGTQWAMGTLAIAELIDTAEFIAGLPFAGLEHVRAYREIRDSRRDLIHLRLLDLWAADQ